MSTVMGIFVKFWHFFTMPAYQIWSCHVTQEANFENFLFCPNSTFYIRKSHKISSGKVLYFRSYQPRTSREWNPPPPSAFRVNSVNFLGKTGFKNQLFSLYTSNKVYCQKFPFPVLQNFPLAGIKRLRGSVPKLE